jgi:pyruvate kinase
LTLPAITEKDEQDLAFAIEQDVDYIAMSFVRNAEDVEQLRKLIDEEHDKPKLPIISKIEKREALINIDEIVSVSDGVMVARGDLGVETPLAAVPVEQKRIIRICNRAGKPVITATQMLNSMISSPRPTRAEATDVANAIIDGTDAVKLSGESASGDYPVESVKTMTEIALIAEKHLLENRREHLQHIPNSFQQITEAAMGKDHITADAVSHSTVRLAEAVEAAMIVVSTWTGYTARRVARERPMTPIVCITPNYKSYRRMALVWGVLPILTSKFDSIEGLFNTVNNSMLTHGLARPGERVVIISGVPFGEAGSTNFVKIQEIQ